MKNLLKATLAGSFILLIVLLLLQMCRSYRGEPSVRDRAEEVGGDGDIKVTLLWDFPGDVDLHVNMPNGEELSYLNTHSGGGELDVDNMEGGEGSAENAYWENPRDGHYKVRVVYYRVSDEAPTGGVVHVVVKIHGETQQYDVTLTERGQDVTVTEFDYRRNN